MELAVTKGTTRSKRIARPSSSSPSSSTSSRGLSGRVGVRVLMHRDLITCQFFRSLPQTGLKKYWGQRERQSNKRRPPASSSSSSTSTPHWSSSPFSSRSPSVSFQYLRLPISRLSFPVLKDRDREREQLGPASSQVLDGHQGFLTTPGMTISPWGSSTQPTAAHTTSYTAASASSFGHSLHHNNSSGWVFLPHELDVFSLPLKAFFVYNNFLFFCN